MGEAVEQRDWYAGDLVELLIVFGASVSMFLVLSLILFVYLRLKFSASQVEKRDSLDLTLAESHTRAVRILSLAGILLQLTLVAYISDDSSSGTSTTQRVPYLFSLVRPVLNTCVYFLDFMTNTHGAFRDAHHDDRVQSDAGAPVRQRRVSVHGRGDAHGAQDAGLVQLVPEPMAAAGDRVSVRGHRCVLVALLDAATLALALALQRPHGSKMMAKDVAMAPMVTATARPKAASAKRKVFHVRLSPDAPSEINFRELVRSLEDASGRQEQQHKTEHNGGSDPILSGQSNGALPSAAGPGNASVDGQPSALAGPRSQRYNIIERLEKRYGGGAIVDCSDTAFGATDGGNGAGGGFERGEEDDYYDSEDSFIDDEELQQNIEDIHGQAHVKTKHSGFFVNAGDEIETIDKDDGDDMGDAGAHRSSKKSKRGSGTESSKAVKAFLDEWSEAASDWMPEPEVIAKMEALRDAVREPIIEDRDVAEKLHFVLAAQDEWINKENDYRQMLKTEDKKNLKEQDYVALNLRQEKNRIFNRVLGLFSSGLMDLPTLRSMNKAAKSKLPRKPAAQAKGAATGAAVKRKNPSATTPTASLPSPVPPVKRQIKAFKSRMMEDAPVFNEDDFQEVEFDE
ncbi:Glutathionyl-hydroquinone reductase yqjg, partial [Globisporangium splendens]